MTPKCFRNHSIIQSLQIIRVTFWTRFDQSLREDERQHIETNSAPNKPTLDTKSLDTNDIDDVESDIHMMKDASNSPDGLDKLPKKMCNRGDQETEFMLEDVTGQVIIKGITGFVIIMSSEINVCLVIINSLM